MAIYDFPVTEYTVGSGGDFATCEAAFGGVI